MPRPLFDSPYIFGLHDPGGEYLMDAGTAVAGLSSPSQSVRIQMT